MERRETRMEHAAEIKTLLGYRDFEDQPEHWRLVQGLLLVRKARYRFIEFFHDFWLHIVGIV